MIDFFSVQIHTCRPPGGGYTSFLRTQDVPLTPEQPQFASESFWFVSPTFTGATRGQAEAALLRWFAEELERRRLSEEVERQLSAG